MLVAGANKIVLSVYLVGHDIHYDAMVTVVESIPYYS